MSADPKLTKARLAGLNVLSGLYPAGARRTSYRTSLAAGHVYWQTADWLVSRGYAFVLASTAGSPDGEMIHLTPAGLALANEVI